MSESKHTTGIWTDVEDDGDLLIVASRDDEADDPTICAVNTHGKSDEEVAANVRLMTAAPDLLIALKNARRELWALYLARGYAEEYVVRVLRAYDAAIAKAEGRA
jgi:hypothetical protein